MKKKSARRRQRTGGRNESGQLDLFLFLRGERLGGGGGLGGALLEFVHAAGGVHEFLLAGAKRMADVANADDDGRLGGTRLDHVAAGATDFRVHIFRMNVRLHKRDDKTITVLLNDKREFYTPPIHLRSSQTALMEVRLRESKIFFAAATRSPFFKLLKASLALMATNCSTLGSR